jgi:hypothetical protein
MSGSRGKPPKWVSIHPDYIAFKEQKGISTPVPIKVTVEQLKVTTTMIRYWRLVGLNAPEDEIKTKLSCNPCYVAALNPAGAIVELNKVFKFPVSPLELQTMWKEIKPTEFMSKEAGVYELKGESWTKR